MGRLLRDDIPQRVNFGNATIWAYRDARAELVGFGTIDVCDDYAYLIDKPLHVHIPLLAVKPGQQGKGYGKYIIDHLIGEAYLLHRHSEGSCHNSVFLEVYVSSTAAIALYKGRGFVQVGSQAFNDPVESQNYYVMVRRL